MTRPGWIVAALLLLLAQGPLAGAGPVEVRVEPGRVTVNAHDAPLGEILQALSQRAGVHVVFDAQRSAQPVTVRLEAGGIHEAIVRLMREVGGGNYAIFSSNLQGKAEPFAFHEGGAAPPAPQATPPAAPASAGPPAYPVRDESIARAPGPTYPAERPAAPSAAYGSIVNRSMVPAVAAAAADVNAGGRGSADARDELWDIEYQERLEITRRGLEKGAKRIDED